MSPFEILVEHLDNLSTGFPPVEGGLEILGTAQNKYGKGLKKGYWNR